MSTLSFRLRAKNGGRITLCIFFAIGLLILLAAYACSTKDPVDVLIADLEEAVEEREIKVVDKLLAADFTGLDGISREQALSTLNRYFAGYEHINIDITQMERPTRDRVRFRATFSGRGKEALGLRELLPSNASYHFELRFVDEGGTLKVHRAFWSELSGL